MPRQLSLYRSGSAFRPRHCLLVAVLFLAAGKANAAIGEFSLGLSATYFHYVEQLQDPAKSTETAFLPGVLAQGRAYFAENTYLRAKYDYVPTINSRYDGSSLNGNIPISATDPVSMTTFEFDFYVGVNSRLAFFVGYGGRNWNRFLSSGSGYREIYSWNVTPVGIQYCFYDEGGLTFAVEPSYRPTSNGHIQVITSGTTVGGVDSQMDIGSKAGYRIAFPSRLASGSVFFSATPWYEHSEIGQSNVVVNTTLAPGQGEGIQEPSSKTDQLGIEMMAGFTF